MNISTTRRTCILGLIAVFSAGSTPYRPVRLTEQELRTIEAARWAHLHGDNLAVVNTLAPLVARANAEKRQAIDKELEDRGSPQSLPLLSSARVHLAQQGLYSKHLPRPGVQEIVPLLKLLKQEIDATIELAGHAKPLADAADAPQNLDEWENVIWSFHVLKNRLERAVQLAMYGSDVARGFPRAKIAQLPALDRETLETDYSQMATHATTAIQRAEEQEIRARLDRLAAARQVLENPRRSPDRVRAAYVADFDERVISHFFSATKNRRSPPADAVIEPAFVERFNSEAARAHELAGPLTQKARLLFEGLHWWLRGRYGLGPEVGGLAKSSAALRSPIAQMALFMPSKMPKPTDPLLESEAGAVPKFERRHHYWWAWEDRRLRRIAPVQLAVDSNSSERFTATLTQFW